MARYAIWNKESPIITPIGEVLTAEEWKNRYPIAAIDAIKIVCAGGEINGAFFGVLSQMMEMYATQGCDFTGCTTDQEKLDAIEAFEDLMNTTSDDPSTDERIAAALEYQVMSSLPDEEVTA